MIYKALHKGDVNNRFTRAYRKSTVRIAEPLRNEDCSTATCLHLWQFINENSNVPKGLIALVCYANYTPVYRTKAKGLQVSTYPSG